MSRIDRWFSEEPPRPPAEIACLLSRGRFWRDERQRLIGSHRDWDEGADYLLGLPSELGHALVLVLSRLPAARRRPFADAFYEQRQSAPAFPPDDDARRLALAAAIVLRLATVLNDADIYDERTLDLLRGTAHTGLCRVLGLELKSNPGNLLSKRGENGRWRAAQVISLEPLR